MQEKIKLRIIRYGGEEVLLEVDKDTVYSDMYLHHKASDGCRLVLPGHRLFLSSNEKMQDLANTYGHSGLLTLYENLRGPQLLFVKTQTEEFYITIQDRDMTIGDLKEEIKKKTGCVIDAQVLKLKDVALENHKTLADYDIFKHEILNLEVLEKEQTLLPSKKQKPQAKQPPANSYNLTYCLSAAAGGALLLSCGYYLCSKTSLSLIGEFSPKVCLGAAVVGAVLGACFAQVMDGPSK